MYDGEQDEVAGGTNDCPYRPIHTRDLIYSPVLDPSEGILNAEIPMPAYGSGLWLYIKIGCRVVSYEQGNWPINESEGDLRHDVLVFANAVFKDPVIDWGDPPGLLQVTGEDRNPRFVHEGLGPVQYHIKREPCCGEIVAVFSQPGKMTAMLHTNCFGKAWLHRRLAYNYE